MIVSATVAVELQLNGSTWTDVAADVNSDVTCEYGISGIGPMDRVASTGRLSFDLLNTTSNSGGKAGYYSPGAANCRSGFALGCPARLRITYAGTVWTVWQGRISTITPQAGPYGMRSTGVTCLDWIDTAATAKLAQMVIQENKRGDEVLDIVLAGISGSPTYISTPGTETFLTALDYVRDETTSLMAEFQKVASSELGYIYMAGGSSGSYALRFDGRDGWYGRPTLTEIETQPSGMTVQHDVGNIYNTVLITIAPRTTSASTEATLWQAEEDIPIKCLTSIDIIAPYRDSDQPAQRIAGSAVIPCEAVTDYEMQNDEGDDRTEWLTVTGDYGGNSAKLTLSNTRNRAGRPTYYVTFLRLRGQAVYYSYSTATASASGSASVSDYGERALSFQASYLQDIETANKYAAYLLNVHGTARPAISDLVIYGNANATNMGLVLGTSIGDLVHVTDDQSGLDDDYRLHHVRLACGVRTGDIRSSWLLAPMEREWLLDVEHFSELEDVTVLGL